jgi:hypothetical protein
MSGVNNIDTNLSSTPRIPEANMTTVLRKEDIDKLIDDPYFKYLVDKTARTQTWAFLAIIGSVLAAILVYAGVEFKSAKGEIERAKSDIRNNVVASQDEVEKVKASSQDAQMMAGNAQNRLEKINGLLDSVQRYGAESERRSMAIVEAAQGHINTSSAIQSSFLNTQKELLGGVAAIVSRANDDVEKINDVLDELKDENIPQKLSSVRDELSKVEKASAYVEKVSNDVDEQVKSLKSLQTVNYELIKARSSESITLRAHQSYVMQLPDLDNLILNPNSKSHLWVTFKVLGLGKHFDISWKVQRDDGFVVSNGTQLIVASQKRMSMSDIPYPLTNTPYEFVVEYSNYGIFAHDFVVLKVRPVRKTAPSQTTATQSGSEQALP